MHKKEHKIIAAIVIIAVIALAFVLSAREKKENSEQKPYSVVYLTSGEIYIGKVSIEHHKLELTNGYSLQVTKDPNDPNNPAKNSFNLQPLDQVIWAPQELTLTPENVVFYGPLQPGSKIAQALAQQAK